MPILLSNNGLGGGLKVSGNSTGGFKARYVPPPYIDTDAQAFFDRVTAAGGTLTATEQSAVNTLVISMKSTNVWTLMKALYPMVGGSPAACAQNLKSSSFTGTFSGGWAYSSTGITGNGINTYMNTGLIPSTQLSQNSAHLAGYLRTTNSANNTLVGAPGLYLLNYGYAAIHNADVGAVNVAGQTGFFLNSRLIPTQIYQYKNNTTLGSYTSTSTTPTASPVYVGAINSVPVQNYVNGQIALASIGDGLTDTQEANYYAAVQAFQTSLSRQIW